MKSFLAICLSLSCVSLAAAWDSGRDVPEFARAYRRGYEQALQGRDPNDHEQGMLYIRDGPGQYSGYDMLPREARWEDVEHFQYRRHANKNAAPAKPLQYDPKNDVRANARKENAARPSCKSANDCRDHCKKEVKDSKSPMSTCNFPPGKKDAQGVCTCAKGDAIAKLVGDVLTAVGETACLVWNKGVEMGIDLITTAAPGGLAKTAAQKSAVQAIKKAGGIGGKAGVIDFCKGHKFTKVDPNLVNKAIPI